MTRLALACKCGDCTHWEILHESKALRSKAVVVLKCVTCGVEYPAVVQPNAHDQLVWVAERTTEPLGAEHARFEDDGGS